MQPRTGGPRSTLTAAQVEGLITGPTVTVDAGCESIDVATGAVTDISEHLIPEGSSVSSAAYATVHRTCRLRLSTELPWASTLLRPFMTLSHGALTARFDLGVYEPGTPEDVAGEDPQTWDVEGYDRLSRLRWAIGSTYRVAASSGALTAVSAAITAAQEDALGVVLEGIGADPTLTSDWVWPIAADSTWLRVCNDLLGSVGYRGIWCDWLGRYRSEPYLSPSVRGTEWTYHADDPSLSIIEDGRRRARDIFPVPNRWVFVRRNIDQAAPADGDGIAVFDNVDVGPASRNAFAGKIRTEVVEVDAESHAALEAQGRRIVEAAMGVATYLEVSTSPNPLHWHFDAVRLRDGPEDSRWLVTDWDLPLDGSPMRQSWRRIDPAPEVS